MVPNMDPIMLDGPAGAADQVCSASNFSISAF